MSSRMEIDFSSGGILFLEFRVLFFVEMEHLAPGLSLWKNIFPEDFAKHQRYTALRPPMHTLCTLVNYWQNDLSQQQSDSQEIVYAHTMAIQSMREIKQLKEDTIRRHKHEFKDLSPLKDSEELAKKIKPSLSVHGDDRVWDVVVEARKVLDQAENCVGSPELESAMKSTQDYLSSQPKFTVPGSHLELEEGLREHANWLVAAIGVLKSIKPEALGGIDEARQFVLDKTRFLIYCDMRLYIDYANNRDGKPGTTAFCANNRVVNAHHIKAQESSAASCIEAFWSRRLWKLQEELKGLIKSNILPRLDGETG
ncbi:hypothetical protein EJ04DRAFT_589378 [Polyplosphaeria fusca]|uniref:Uncharacterized protein n=1 Tax=Polyplosphaeria fusca TaxID=682080 RepID=A0A9P4QMI6_9PLEO|nr:hypothetical protein EJ04DRAFT_589378 [Polyplosphaeria fusca]